MFERFIETPGLVQGYAIDANVYLLSDNRVQVYDGRTRQRIEETRLFKKDGLSRSLRMDDRFLYLTDFVDLHVLDKRRLNAVARIRLGTDLSSDICGGAVDSDGSYLYLGIRNGSLARVRIGAWDDVHLFPLSAGSMWTLRTDPSGLYAGNVEGQLLLIDPGSMTVRRKVQAHRQNLKSLCLSGELIATAGQDKALALWDRGTLELVRVRRNAHKKAFGLAGLWKGRLLTVSYPCGEIKVWNLDSLEETGRVPIAGCLSGQASLQGSRLFLSSRAINGIDRLDLRGLLH